MDFKNIRYLKEGNPKQQKVYQLLNDFQIIEKLENYNPLVVGTIPIEIDLDDSDVDIILQTNDCNDLEKFLLDKFSYFRNFKMDRRMSDKQNILVCNFVIDQIPFEVYAENKPTHLQYGFLHMMKEFEILNQKGIDFSLTIVGDGTRLQFLKDLAKELQIKNKVIFTGRIPNTELPQLLQRSNIYISMPITEGVSASLFEAMACNCYPVVSDIPGNQSWITHRENGQLVEIDNIEMLAEELIWSFENPESRNEAVIRNRKFVEENANYDINMRIISEKYHELLYARFK